MPADGQPPGRRTGWRALTTTQRGAAHVAANLPNQDAVVAEPAGPDGIVAAVADGHGHWRHGRSARGSQLAVEVGCRTAGELAGLLEDEETFHPKRAAEPDALPVASQISELVRETLVPTLVQRWREAVLADVAASPFSAEEQESRQQGDDPTIAYGSTLLLAVAVRKWLVLAQIGDGDIVGVRADGTAVQPVPDDPQLDGRFTTSLCGLDAASDFRTAVINVSHSPLAAVVLASDGYGNAQIADRWTEAFSKDLAEMLRERDEPWLATQLPMWAARCASAEGSADDTTVALLLGPPGLGRNVPPAASPGGGHADFGSEDVTVPAVFRSATIPNAQVLTGQGPIEPVTLRLMAVDPPAGPTPAGDGGPAAAAGAAGPATTTPTAIPVRTEPVTAEPAAGERAISEPPVAEPATGELTTGELTENRGAGEHPSPAKHRRRWTISFVRDDPAPAETSLGETSLGETNPAEQATTEHPRAAQAAAGQGATEPAAGDVSETTPWPGDR